MPFGSIISYKMGHENMIALCVLLIVFIIEISSLPIKRESTRNHPNDIIETSTASEIETWTNIQCQRKFLSANGLDKHGCGRSALGACQTLDFLLEQTKLSSKCLHLKTESSLTIDEPLQERHPWLKNFSLVLSRYGDSKKVTIFLNNLKFAGGTWIIHDLKTKIRSCDLSELNLRVSSSVNSMHKTSIRFSNCNLGRTTVNNVEDITIHDCSLHWLATNNATLLTFKRSRVGIWNTSFDDNSGDSLIRATDETNLVIHKCSFKENYMKRGVLLLEQSTLILQDAVFSKNQGLTNGGCINAWNNTKITIEDTKFSDNSATEAGGVIYVFNHVQMDITRTEFFRNFANSAGAIAIYEFSHVRVSDSNFTFNSGISYTGTIKLYYNCSLSLNNTILSHNTVQQSVGGVAAGDNSSVLIVNSFFKNNTSQLKNAGALYLEVDTKLVIVNSQFVQNSAAQIGGVLNMYKNCSAEIRGSFFSENTAGDSSGVLNMVGQCSLNISRSSFIGNVASFSGGVIASNGQDQVHISDSYFQNNTAFTGIGGCISNSDGSYVMILNSIFEENYSGYQAAAIYFTSSRGTILGCSFTRNRAAIFAGALVMEKSNITIAKSLFHENKAQSEGGALVTREAILTIVDSNFTGNKAVYRSGGAMIVQHESAIIVQNTDFISNTAAYTGGVVMASGSSTITYENVRVISNSAQIAGALSLQPNTKFKAVNCKFFGNSASGYTGVMFVSFNVEADIANSTFENNTAAAMAGVAYVIRGTVKLSETSFINNSASKGRSFYFFGKHDNHIFTYKTSFCTRGQTVRSDYKDIFWDLVKKRNEVWVDPASKLQNIETTFASVIPEKCYNGCHCYYDQIRDLNIFNCSNRNFSQLPLTVPTNTDWLDLSRNNISNLQYIPSYFGNIRHIDLSFNNVTELDDKLVHLLGNKTSMISHFNLEGNRISKLPESVKELTTITELRLGGNPYICDCDTLWMQKWLHELSQEKTFVPDFKNMTCGPGSLQNKAIIELDREALGCSLQWYWIVVLASVSVTLFVTVALLLHRNWETLKFCLFVHFDILTTDDGVENLDDMLYDGFVCYSREDQMWVITEVLNYLEESFGFRICIHQRDFTIGSPIICNITDSILHSRRMILIVSKSFITSGWCMEEFRIAHEQFVSGRRKFLIPVLLEDIKDLELPDDLRLYLDTYTYLEVEHSDSLIRKKLRYAMPKTPLTDLKSLPPRIEYTRIRSASSDTQSTMIYSSDSSTDEESESDSHDEHNVTCETDLPSPSPSEQTASI